jgi:hypothetical protein
MPSRVSKISSWGTSDGLAQTLLGKGESSSAMLNPSVFQKNKIFKNQYLSKATVLGEHHEH